LDLELATVVVAVFATFAAWVWEGQRGLRALTTPEQADVALAREHPSAPWLVFLALFGAGTQRVITDLVAAAGREVDSTVSWLAAAGIVLAFGALTHLIRRWGIVSLQYTLMLRAHGGTGPGTSLAGWGGSDDRRLAFLSTGWVVFATLLYTFVGLVSVSLTVEAAREEDPFAALFACLSLLVFGRAAWIVLAAVRNPKAPVARAIERAVYVSPERRHQLLEAALVIDPEAALIHPEAAHLR